MQCKHRLWIMHRAIVAGTLAVAVAMLTAAAAHAQIAVLKQDTGADESALVQRTAQPLGTESFDFYDRSTPVQAVTQASGIRVVYLPDDFMEIATVELLPNGTLEMRCGQGTLESLDLLGTGGLISSMFDSNLTARR